MDDTPRTAALVAILDQANAALQDVADMLATYRQLLVAAGFSEDDALELCLQVQRAVIFGKQSEPS